MGPDDQICYCCHVSFRKLYHFARRHHLQKPSQMSDCLGAGTGCGWCIPILKRVYEAAQSHVDRELIIEMTPEQYAEARRKYIENRGPRHSFD